MALKAESRVIEFKGPYNRITQSHVLVTNTEKNKRVVIKVKVDKSKLVRAKPVFAFVEANSSLIIKFQTSALQQGIKKRLKASICYATTPNGVQNAKAFAKSDSPKKSWKHLKMRLSYPDLRSASSATSTATTISQSTKTTGTTHNTENTNNQG